ncbi:MAG: AAA family ATPase [Anaerolineae bacterium]|nr:AAA family ATPase [Anaerolineae bacterium]
MTKLVISTLGPLEITTAHASGSGFLSDKVRALLVYLALEADRPLRRETLAALLWPGQPEKKARANLRRALANCRQLIDDEDAHYLHITRQTLQFNRAADAIIDAVQFEQLLSDAVPSLAEMEKAVALVRGPFLEGFSISDSIAFEEWVLLKREALQRQQLHLFHELTTYYEAHHQLETAIGYAWQQVCIEPWYEPGQRQLLRLLVQTGQRNTALTHYEEFEQQLVTEIGVPPEPATRRIYSKIRDRAAEMSPVQLPPAFLAEPQTTVAHPFVSREVELDRLHGFLDESVVGQGRIAFVTGEAGSGKTSLLRTFARQAQAQFPSLIPLFGNCEAHAGPGNPYLPFRSMLAQAVGDLEPLWRNGTLTRAQVNRLWQLRQTAVKLLQSAAPDCMTMLVDPALLPEDARTVTDANSPAQELIFQQMGRFLQEFSQHGPLLLLLDDLHWIDDASIDLLFHLWRQIAGYPILLLGSYRPEELLPSQPDADRHPLIRFVHELTQDCGEIEVALDRADGRSFVNAWLDSAQYDLDETVREMIFERTQGHALFTVELVAALQERGGLRRNGQGRWHVADADVWAKLPSRTEAIVSERFGRLPSPLRQLLSVAGIQGETFAAEVVAQVVNRPLREVIHLLSAVLDRSHRLIQSEGRQQVGSQTISRYRFRHNLFQKYVYGHLDANELAYLHRLTAEGLAELYTSADIEPMAVAAELAYHFESAQVPDKAAHYYQLAGQYALQLSANSAASDHFRRSLALLSTLPETPENVAQQIDCGLALGAALLATRGYAASEVKAVYDRVYELCGQVRASAEMVTSLFWLTSYYAVQGDLAQAVAVSRKMLAVVDQETLSDMHHMRAHVLAGLPLFFMGDNETALAHFQLATSLYDPVKHQPLVYSFGQDPGIAGMLWQGHVRLHMGRLTEARRCLEQALTWSSTLDHPYTTAFTHMLAATTFNSEYLRELKTAMTHIQSAVKLAKEGGFAYLLAICTFYWGGITVATCLQQGDSSQAAIAAGFDLMQQGMDMESAIGSKLGITTRWLVLANMHRQCGQIDQAWHALEQAEAEAHCRQELYFEAEILRVKGHIYQLVGEPQRAEACMQQALASARRQKARFWELRVTTALCRHWQQQGKQAQARPLLTNVLQWFDSELESADVLEARALLSDRSQRFVCSN